jgi:hypothetical protein
VFDGCIEEFGNSDVVGLEEAGGGGAEELRDGKIVVKEFGD